MSSESDTSGTAAHDAEEAHEQQVDDLAVQLIEANQANATIQDWVSRFGSILPTPVRKAISDLDLALNGEPDDDWQKREPDTWRSKAAAKVKWLDVVDKMEDKTLRDLCMALREGLTPEQQRTVAMDLLGGPYVRMGLRLCNQPGLLTEVLVPDRVAHSLRDAQVVLVENQPQLERQNPGT